MSYFSLKLARMMKERDWSAAELSRLTRIPKPKLSRWLNDVQTHVDPSDIETLCHALGRDKKEKAALLVAHLQDLCTGPGSDLVQIQIGDQPMLLIDHHTRPLTPALEDAFALLRANIGDPDLQHLLLGLASLYRKKTLSAPEEKGKKYP
jgi:transcriptional regulator with XRE-family HTH domain